jgi:DNA polymerase-3 subunit beta
MSQEKTTSKGDFSIARDILNEAMQLVSASVSTKASTWNHPYIGNLLIVASESGLELRAADEEAIVSLTVQGALVTENGKAVVPLVLLRDLVKSFPGGGRVDVRLNNEGTIVKCGRSKSTLTAAVEPDDFPLGAETDGEGISLKRDALVEIAGQVAVAASTDTSRPALTGVCFEFSSEEPALSKSKGLILVAADGFRLAVRSLPLETEQAGTEAKMVIPASSLKRLLKVLRKLDDETVTLHIMGEGKRAVFRADRFQMETLTIAHPFPKWEQIVPKSYDASMTVDTTALTLALKQARLFPDEQSSASVVKLEFLNSGENLLRISANTSLTGDYTGTLPVASVENEPVTFGMNGRFLLEMLPKLGQTIQIKTNRETDPVVLAGGEMTYVVMPVTLRS